MDFEDLFNAPRSPSDFIPESAERRDEEDARERLVRAKRFLSFAEGCLSGDPRHDHKEDVVMKIDRALEDAEINLAIAGGNIDLPEWVFWSALYSARYNRQMKYYGMVGSLKLAFSALQQCLAIVEKAIQGDPPPLAGLE